MTLPLTGAGSVGLGKFLSLNFAAGIYRFNGVTYPDFATFLSGSGSTFTRGSAGYDLAATQSFLSNVARITGAGLTYEAAGTNLMPNSAAFGTGWSNGGATVTSDAAVAPDGTTTADFYGCNGHANDGSGYLQQQVTSSAGVITRSAFVKAKTWTWLRFGIFDGSWKVAHFNIATGVVGTVGGGVTAAVAALANSEYRLSVSITAGGANVFGGYLLTDADNSDASAGSAVNGAYLWGDQVEAKSSASSYVPTTAGSASRSADALTIAVPSGLSTLTVTFDDNSTQVITGATGNYLLPTSINRPTIKSLVWGV